MAAEARKTRRLDDIADSPEMVEAPDLPRKLRLAG
jgi:hypothetical protein